MEDVLIVENKTGKIEAIIGKNLNDRQSERRQMTGLSRINEDYHIDTCATGTYKVGDIKKYG